MCFNSQRRRPLSAPSVRSKRVLNPTFRSRCAAQGPRIPASLCARCTSLTRAQNQLVLGRRSSSPWGNDNGVIEEAGLNERPDSSMQLFDKCWVFSPRTLRCTGREATCARRTIIYHRLSLCDSDYFLGVGTITSSVLQWLSKVLFKLFNAFVHLFFSTNFQDHSPWKSVISQQLQAAADLQTYAQLVWFISVRLKSLSLANCNLTLRFSCLSLQGFGQQVKHVIFH